MEVAKIYPLNQREVFVIAYGNKECVPLSLIYNTNTHFLLSWKVPHTIEPATCIGGLLSINVH